MRDLVVRAAAEADLPEIRRLLVETWHDTYDATLGRERVTAITDTWHSPAALALQLRQDGVFLVAEREGRLLGTCLLTYPEAGAALLNRLYVAPEAQGKGVGRRLLAATLAEAQGAGEVRLEVEPENRRAIRFYEREGFTALTAAPGCGGDATLRSLRMVRRLQPAPRAVCDDDAQDLFGLLALCFAEYPGCYVDPHDDLADLIRPAAGAAAKEVSFWVAEDARGRVAACVSVDFPQADVAELHRLYVRPDQRRRGLGARLVGLAEDHARAWGAQRLFFWSDTRFTDAHRLYERLGYVRDEGTRELGDISNSVEYRFEKAL